MTLACLVAGTAAGAAHKAERRIHARMDEVLGPYLALARDLANDRPDKLAERSGSLRKVLRKVLKLLPRPKRQKKKRRKKKGHAKKSHGTKGHTDMTPHGDYYTERPRATMARLREQVAEALDLLEKHAADFHSNDLARVRKHFFALSQPLIRYVGYFRAKEGKYWTIWCEMKKAAWLQTDLTVRNPFYGRTMHSCGKQVRTHGEPEVPGKSAEPTTQPAAPASAKAAPHRH